VANGERNGKGEGRRGRDREMRRKARDRQMPSGRNSNFCAAVPGSSAAAPFNNNLYYFNDLRPWSPPPLLGDLVRARLRRTTFGRAGSHVFRSMVTVTSYPRGDYISVFSNRISSEFFELRVGLLISGYFIECTR